MPAIQVYACRIANGTVTGARSTNRLVDRQGAAADPALSFCGSPEGWIRPNIYFVTLIVPVRRAVDLLKLRQGAVEFSPSVLETDIQRTDIDRIEAGGAACAYTHQSVRDRRGRSAIVHVVADQYVLEPVVCAEFPGSPQ